MAQSTDEKRLIKDQTCLDESVCYGPKRFKRYTFKRFPDLAHVKYEALASDADDSDMVSTCRDNFIQGLYFAKQIQLANGQSFMTLCARAVSA